jgi:hypothetical protein
MTNKTQPIRDSGLVDEKLHNIMLAHLDGVYMLSARDDCDVIVSEIIKLALRTQPAQQVSEDVLYAKRQLGRYANLHPDESEKMSFGHILKCIWNLLGAKEMVGYRCAETLASVLDKAALQPSTKEVL